MNVVGYIVSYKDKGPDRLVENKIQQEKIKTFCEQNSLNLIKIYTDSVQKGMEPRHALVEIMNKAPEKEFSGVLVYNFDRLAQEEELSTWIITELKSFGIEVFSLTQAPPMSVGQKAEKKSQTLKEKLKDLPSLPEVVVKISELVQNPLSSAAQLGKIIAQDSGLTSRVLRLVNSAYYGFPGQISSIQHAITILGFTTIKGLVLSSSIFRIFSSKQGAQSGLDYKNIWRHSLLTAIASRIIYQRLFFQTDENIFSSAILHDIGKIILDQYDHDNYILAMGEASEPLYHDAVLESEKKYCEVEHTYIGDYVARGWNLPESLCDVIRYHHSPLGSENNQKLTVSVYLGNILSHLVLDYESFNIDNFDENTLQAFGVGEDELFLIYEELKRESENIQDIESFFK